jgi:hypothetical protein
MPFIPILIRLDVLTVGELVEVMITLDIRLAALVDIVASAVVLELFQLDLVMRLYFTMTDYLFRSVFSTRWLTILTRDVHT